MLGSCKFTILLWNIYILLICASALCSGFKKIKTKTKSQNLVPFSANDVAHGIIKHSSQHLHIDIFTLVRNNTFHWYITCIGVTWQPQTGVTAFQFWNMTYVKSCFSVSKDTSHGCRMWPWWWIKACPCWILVKKIHAKEFRKQETSSSRFQENYIVHDFCTH